MIRRHREYGMERFPMSNAPRVYRNQMVKFKLKGKNVEGKAIANSVDNAVEVSLNQKTYLCSHFESRDGWICHK